MTPAGLFIEILHLILFGIILFFVIKRGKGERVLFFILPFLVLEAGIEFMSIHIGHKFNYSPEKFLFLVFGLPPAVFSAWAFGLYVASFITERIFSRNYIPVFLLAASDAFFVDVLSVLMSSILTSYGWIRYDPGRYHLGSSLFGVPAWEFIGAFILVFIVSFVYRSLKNMQPGKRIFLTYGFIFFTILGRFLLYSLKYVF